MTAGTANWSFTQDDFTAITESLQRFLGETKSLCALLVDRSGQLVTTVGDSPGLDTRSLLSRPLTTAPTTSSRNWLVRTTSPASSIRVKRSLSTSPTSLGGSCW